MGDSCGGGREEERRQVAGKGGGRITLATCVDSIRDSWRKISGAAAAGATVVKGHNGVVGDTADAERDYHHHGRHPRHGGYVSGPRRKRGLVSSDHLISGGSGPKRKTSFELFLSSLPKLDPIDRTVGWVFQQPTDTLHTGCPPSPLTHLPPRGMVLPNVRCNSRGTHTSAADCDDTSLSYCESARGTGGRGTPPIREAGQPRLDDLFRQLQLRQERAVRRRMARKGERHHMTLRNYEDIAASQLPGYPPGVTSDLLPYLSNHPPTILHKNSSYYNRVGVVTSSQPRPQACRWRGCVVMCPTVKELLAHVVDEHLSVLPLRNHSGVKVQSSRRGQLVCEWQGCSESSRVFGARYKLLIHLQTAHCTLHKVDHVDPTCTAVRGGELRPAATLKTSHVTSHVTKRGSRLRPTNDVYSNNHHGNHINPNT